MAFDKEGFEKRQQQIENLLKAFLLKYPEVAKSNPAAKSIWTIAFNAGARWEMDEREAAFAASLYGTEKKAEAEKN